jgi:hypothetical protein
VGIRSGFACRLLAFVPLASCWLTSSFDGLVVDAGTRDGGDGSAGLPDSGPDSGGSGPSDAPSEALPLDAACVADAYVTLVRSDHPLAYYRLDEQAPATVAFDSSGNGNAGMYSDVTLGVPGAIKTDPTDTAAGFNGMTSVVTVGAQLSFVGTLPFTVEAWIYPTMLDSEYRGVLSSESTTDAPRYGYLLYVAAPDASVRSGFERWGGSASNPTVWSGTITTDAWFHVVGTFDPNAVSPLPKMRYYVNGTPVALYDKMLVDITQPSTFVIGALNGDNANIPSTFKGSIDEVAVYDHALDAGCVMAHYTLGTGQ